MIIISTLQIRKQILNEVRQFVQSGNSAALSMAVTVSTRRLFAGWSHCAKSHTEDLGQQWKIGWKDLVGKVCGNLVFTESFSPKE